MLSLTEAKKRFKGEWIAFVIKKKLSADELLGEVVAHDKDKQNLHRILREKKISDTYITFSGPYIEPGYEAMFF